MAHSLLMVPVPELDDVVRRRLAALTPELLPRPWGGPQGSAGHTGSGSAGSAGSAAASADDTVAHVTLLGPFAPMADITDGVVAELARFFADVTPFVFRLTRVSRFPGGTVYLTPDPASPFRQLTFALARRFPEHPPYGGAFDDVVPHLSVPVADDEDVADVEAELAGRLPVVAHAQEAVLYWWEEGASRTLEVFPFGTSAA